MIFREDTHKHLGYVDPRTVMTPSHHKMSDQLVMLELRRIGYKYLVFADLGTNLDYAFQLLSENHSGNRWTTVTLLTLHKRVFAFRDAKDAVLIKLAT